MTSSARRSTQPVARAPKQERSQKSFDRVLDSSLELLAERGYAGFALTEVSRRSGVSTGSIYVRVDGKDDLLRAAQERFLEKMAGEHARLTDPERYEGKNLVQVVGELVSGLATMLLRNARVLGAFQQRAVSDPLVARAGKASYMDLVGRFSQLLLGHRDEIAHSDPEHAVVSCFQVAYATLARTLALDVSQDAAEDHELAAITEDLGLMCIAFLTWPGGDATN
ncbi:TetR/AcrR family transcriptional regulator [Streptomyces graminofaciens]|uniref:TetR/AcrR family transcriptional regulator n=1 Tax=Streptomyces graminofaciens TaxID=68212 RepID=UPI0025745705|nr:TetR/AcrR family transcriptional regulator [Streptomyces graminofaciens]